MQMQEYLPLAPFTTFGIGGPARWFVEAGSEADVTEAAEWTRKHGVALFVLGGGSNMLVSDAGFDGLVMQVGLRGIDVKDDGAQKIYRVAAGEDWDHCVDLSIEASCAGLECLAGIPGKVGGTPVQNVGAYGQEVASVIERVRAFDLERCTFVEFTAAECEFSYRRSRFNSTDRGRYIVTRVDFRLAPGGTPALRYDDLQRAVQEGRKEIAAPSLADVAAAVRRVRHSKGMLLVEGDPDCRSAGSFFKNPLVSEKQLGQIRKTSGKEPPRFSAGPGQVKLPAAWLIEQAGFPKGYALGAAGVSSRHALALINRGGATAAEIMALSEQIASAVEAKFGIRLEMEPVLVGF